MKRSTLYALKRMNGELCDFHPSRDYVLYVAENTIQSDGKIYRLDVEEASEEQRTHYSYWDYEWERFSFTHKLISGITVNFPYGFDEENRRNKSGIILPVIITERSTENVRT